jgi:hypothetical protein
LKANKIQGAKYGCAERPDAEGYALAERVCSLGPSIDRELHWGMGDREVNRALWAGQGEQGDALDCSGTDGPLMR